LLNNDRVLGDLRTHLRREVGARRCTLYWNIFEKLREELGYADYLGALQRYRCRYPHDSHLLMLSHLLIEYPFHKRLYPKSLAVVRRVKRWGLPVVLSDGDVVFQPRKVERSGILAAVSGRALIFIHKEHELAEVKARYPADHYIMIDDKLRILTAMKKIWKHRVTTVFVRQGHYALDPKIIAACPPADLTIERIGDLLDFELKDFGLW
jgi:hypothetical protein